MSFRLDINGLRAIAVLAVVFFHFNSNWLPGGFAGVDVFFVISGYLMTGIVFKGIERKNFSIWRFYMARARRIIPALAIMILLLLLLGWFYLAPNDYAILSNHAASSVTFISNIVFWQESGYFDAAAHEKWLLHTWSLSVEWQFYLIYPILLVVLNSFLKTAQLKLVLLIGAIVGFIFCSVATIYWPNPSFYLLPTRAWELLLGGIAFIYPLQLKNSHKNIFVLLGISSILVSYIVFTESYIWPGYYSFLPVFGTFLVIWVNKSNSIITNNYPFQKIGAASYSIYLWHWPVVVVINYLGKSADFIFTATGLVISIMLGFLSYNYIEKTCGKLSHKSGNRFAFIMFSIVLILSFTVKSNHGFNSRVDNSYVKITDNLVMPTRDNGYCFYSFLINDNNVGIKEGTTCKLGLVNVKPTTILFGDSFGGHYEPFWNEVLTFKGQSLLSITTNWCHPSLTDSFPGPKNHPAYKQCLLNRQFIVDHITDYNNIVVAGSWANLHNDGYFEEVIDFIDFASNSGVNVIVMPSPTIYDTNVLKRFESSLFNPQFTFRLSEMPKLKDEIAVYVNSLLFDYASNQKNVFYLRRKDIFEPSDLFKDDSIDIPYSLDGGHISLKGSIYSAKFFMSSSKSFQIIDQLIQ